MSAIAKKLSEWSASPTVRSLRLNVNKVDSHCDKLAHTFSGLAGTMMVADGISGMAGGQKSEIINAKNAFGALESGLYVVRSLFTPVKLALGSLFYAVDEDGSLSDKKRQWLESLIDICLFVYRILNPVAWLERMKIIHLGSHANSIKKAATSFCLAVCALCSIKAIKDWWYATDKKSVTYYASNVGTSVADTIEVGFDFSSITSHAASIGIGAVKIFSAACYAIRDIADQIKDD